MSRKASEGVTGGMQHLSVLDGDKQDEAKEVDILKAKVKELEADREALNAQTKRLGDMLKTIRHEAAAHGIDSSILGVDLERSFSMRKDNEQNEIEKDLDNPKVIAMRRLAADNCWLLEPEEVTLATKLGSGATADIYAGLWHNLDVAVKCLRSSFFEGNPENLNSFLLEVSLLAQQRHPYVLHLMGACIQPPDCCWVVTELLPGGTLAEYMYGSKSRQWKRQVPLPPLQDRLRIALEIALAMQYLHEQKPCVIHRDLKPSNVMMSSDSHVRISDFGFARVLNPEDQVLTGETGTYFYMAPEVIRHERYTEKCDVYSFGVMLCELLSGDPPYIDTYFTPLQVAQAVAEGNLRPTLPKYLASPSLLALVESAWATKPKSRPSFAAIARALRQQHKEELLKKVDNGAPGHHSIFGFLSARDK